MAARCLVARRRASSQHHSGSSQSFVYLMANNQVLTTRNSFHCRHRWLKNSLLEVLVPVSRSSENTRPSSETIFRERRYIRANGIAMLVTVEHWTLAHLSTQRAFQCRSNEIRLNTCRLNVSLSFAWPPYRICTTTISTPSSNPDRPRLLALEADAVIEGHKAAMRIHALPSLVMLHAQLKKLLSARRRTTTTTLI